MISNSWIQLPILSGQAQKMALLPLVLTHQMVELGTLIHLFHSIQRLLAMSKLTAYYHFDENYGISYNDDGSWSWVDSMAHSIQVGNIS